MLQASRNQPEPEKGSRATSGPGIGSVQAHLSAFSGVVLGRTRTYVVLHLHTEFFVNLKRFGLHFGVPIYTYR
jgi:hypothetical protein